MIRTYLLSCW